MEFDQKREKRQFSRIGLAYIVYFAASLGAQYILMLLLKVFGINMLTAGSWLIWLISAVSMYLVGFPLFTVMIKRAEACPYERKLEKWGLGHWTVCFFVCIAIMEVGNWIGQLIMLVSGGSSAEFDALEQLITNSDIWLNMLIVVTIGPIVEELMFRRFLIDRIIWYGDKTAVFVSALLFGLIHGNFYQFFYAFGLGLVFGYIYVKTGKIKYTILFHMLINFMGSVVVQLILSGFSAENLMNGLSAAALFGALSLIGYGLFLIGATITGIVLFCCFFKRITFSPAMIPIPKGQRFSSVFFNAGMILLLIYCFWMFI